MKFYILATSKFIYETCVFAIQTCQTQVHYFEAQEAYSYKYDCCTPVLF